MTTETLLDRWGAGWRGPLLAAVLALVAALPGAVGLPPLDRDESRFAEASAQMLETGDFVTIHFQDTPRFKKPVGIYWLQAAAVQILSHVESRAIWAYRVPSLLGGMLAAAACAWGAAAFLRPGAALIAGGLLATSFMLSTEAAIAATDAALCGATTLAMAALGRLYLAERGGPAAGRLTRLLFWLALAATVMLKGPIGPMIVFLAALSLCLWDRRCAWLTRLGWGWGGVILAAVIGPWALAITVATDGAFWGAALGGDLGPKLVGRAEGHGAPPGFYLLLAPLLLFPACLLAPACAVAAWRARTEPAVRLALCWLIPSWLVFEAAPTKLIHYTLPLYGALAWLMARSLESGSPATDDPGVDRGRVAEGPIVRGLGVGVTVLVAAAFAGAGFWAMARLGDASGAAWAVIAAALFLAAGVGGGALLWRRRPAAACVAAAALAALGHGALAGGLAPALHPLWLSSAADRALGAVGASPWQGVTPGPVTVAGYAEPSLVFLLGADTELGDADDASAAIAAGRPAIVARSEEAAFHAALIARGAVAVPIGRVSGLDYSRGRRETLGLYRSPPPARPRRRS